MIMRDKNGPQTKEEKLWHEQFKKAQVLEEGYTNLLQATKPQTLAFAMNNNPVGIAPAWIFEKFYGWSDLKIKIFLKYILKMTY